MADPLPRILFLHIPKTAGLTMRQLVLRRYPRTQVISTAGAIDPTRTAAASYAQYLEIGGTPPGLAPRNALYERFIRELPPERIARTRIVIGHFWFGLHEVLPGPNQYFTIVRDPVERVLSQFQHRRDRHGLDLSVEDYILSERDLHLDNDQVRRLSNTGQTDARVGPCTDEMLARAVRNLDEHFLVAGTTERFQELAVMLGHLLGWGRFAYSSQNVSRGRPHREDLSDAALRVLTRHNEHDAELHRIVTARFDDLIDRTEIDMPRELLSLRRRVRVAEATYPLVDRARGLAARALGRRPSHALPRPVRR